MDLGKILGRMSYHVIYDDSIASAIQFASDNGFSGIQVATDALHLGFESLSDSDISDIRELSRRLGIRINLHGPDHGSLLFPYSRTDRGIISYYSDLIGFAQDVGAKIITIHPGKVSTFKTDTLPIQELPEPDWALYSRILERNLDRLLELSSGKVQICIENLDWTPLLMQTLQDYLNDTDLALCWDIEKMYNKTDLSVKPEIEAFFTRNITKVRQVHLHSLANGLSHRVIQPGPIDFKHYLELLNGVDVLDYCIEVRPREKAVESLNNLKQILSQ